MKKIFTLIVAATLFTSAFAQHNGGSQWDNKGKDVAMTDRNKKDDRLYNDSYAFGNRERDMKIMQINKEYDNKIQLVKFKPFLNRSKKARMIAALEDQRNAEIKMAYAKYNNKKNRFDDKKSNGRW